MERAMRVAVLMSSYNGEKYIGKQIESILAQIDCEVHLFVRDDGSSDSTHDILKGYADEGKLEWYQGENLKPAKSFLKLLYESGEYDYYAFSDQDDIWDKDKLSYGIQYLEKYQDRPAIYSSKTRYIDAEDNLIYGALSHSQGDVVIRTNYWNEMILCGATGCTMILNKAIVDIFKMSSFPQKVLLHDSYMQSMCAALGGVILFDNQAHMGYRQHANNVIGGKKGAFHGIKLRLKSIFEKREVLRSDYAKQFLSFYSGLIPSDNLSMVKTIAEYPNSIENRFKLAFSKNLKFDRLRDSIYNRIAILFANK